LAVPGPVTSALSATPHRLIRDGEAILAASPDDVAAVVGALDPAAEAVARGPDRPSDGLGPDERAVFEDLPGRGAATADDLSARTGLPPPAVLAALGRLAGLGLVEPASYGRWRLATDRRA
jgi:DNA processing protein